jgi:hypothetical protein
VSDNKSDFNLLVSRKSKKNSEQAQFYGSDNITRGFLFKRKEAIELSDLFNSNGLTLFH